MVTIDTIASTTAICWKVSVIMKPLAPNTPVNVAIVGINTSATMLTASDHERASRIAMAPAATTGTEQASAQPAISHRSVTAHSTDSRGPTPSGCGAGPRVSRVTA